MEEELSSQRQFHTCDMKLQRWRCCGLIIYARMGAEGRGEGGRMGGLDKTKDS